MRRFNITIWLMSVLFAVAAAVPASTLAAPAPPPGGSILKQPPSFIRYAPDLYISSLNGAPNPAAVNSSVTYTIGVTNGGLFDATDVRVHWAGGWGGFSQFFQGSISATNGFQCYVPAEYYNMDVRCVGGTIPGGSTATITITVLGPSTAGTRSVSATADPYNEIGESNESNNTASGSTTFL